MSEQRKIQEVKAVKEQKSDDEALADVVKREATKYFNCSLEDDAKGL